jgi:hypothetical protein
MADMGGAMYVNYGVITFETATFTKTSAINGGVFYLDNEAVVTCTN